MSSPLKNLLEQQRKSLESLVKPHEYLATVSPLFNEDSPVRTRMGSAGGARKINSPSKLGGGRIDNAATIVETSAAKQQQLSQSAAVPAAPDAYMQELPLAPYGSTSHLNLHVTETLQLALRILQKNELLGKALSDKDRGLLNEIARFNTAVAASEPTPSATEQTPQE